MAGEVASAARTGRIVGHETVDVVIEYLVPLGTGIAGFVGGEATLGGTYSIANAINSGVSSSGPLYAQSTRVAGLIMGSIWAMLGYAFWRHHKADGWVEKLICGGLGGFFFGTALSVVIFRVIENKVAPSSGLIDMLFGWIGDLSVGK